MLLTMFLRKGRLDSCQWGWAARACLQSLTGPIAGNCARNSICRQCMDLSFTISKHARTLELWSKTKATPSSLRLSHLLRNWTKKPCSATLIFWATKRIDYFSTVSASPQRAKWSDGLRTLMQIRPFRQKDCLASSSSLVQTKKDKKVRKC
jgi:hypothetical protein